MAILIIFLIFSAFLGFSVVKAVFSMVFSLLHVGRVMWQEVLILVVLILLIPLVWRWIRVVIGRLRFTSRLKSICRKGGYTCKFLRNPLSSLVRKDGAYDILIDTDKHRYAVKFFPGNVARRFLHLRGLSLAETEKYYVMPVLDPLWIRHPHVLRFWSSFGVMKKRFFINETTYAKRCRKYRIDVAEDATPVLLFAPEPMRLTGTVANAAKPLGSGEVYEGVTLYEGEGWLRYLERLALE